MRKSPNFRLRVILEGAYQTISWSPALILAVWNIWLSYTLGPRDFEKIVKETVSMWKKEPHRPGGSCVFGGWGNDQLTICLLLKVMWSFLKKQPDWEL